MFRLVFGNALSPIADLISNFSKDGFLFDKEAILQYIVTKKTEYARKLKEFERQKRMEDNEAAELNAVEEQKKLIKFINTEKNIVTSGSSKSMFCE